MRAEQGESGPAVEDASLMSDEQGRGLERLNPDGNERLTAAVGLVVFVLTIVELGTVVFGLHQLLSLHMFVGLVLLPPVLLKLASTGWRFVRYYTGSEAYRSKGAPELAMRMLAPLLVAATVVLFASGVAMGVLHGSDDITRASRAAVRGARGRTYLLASAIVTGVVLGAAAVPVQHHWLNLPRKHHHRDGIAVLRTRASPWRSGR